MSRPFPACAARRLTVLGCERNACVECGRSRMTDPHCQVGPGGPMHGIAGVLEKELPLRDRQTGEEVDICIHNGRAFFRLKKPDDDGQDGPAPASSNLRARCLARC